MRDFNKKYQYIYLYKDHLGNNRLSYTLDPETEQVKILEENHYYPFGLHHNTYTPTKKDIKYQEQLAEQKEIKQVQPAEVVYKYKYNSKELQDELGLGVYDYGARIYDPAVPRFWTIDPLSEKYHYQSTYVYANNNPVLFRDILGMGIEQQEWKKNGDGTYTAEKGDSAATLAKDANISYKEANKLIQMQHGKNRKDKNGNEFSNIKEGDIVAVPEQVEVYNAECTAYEAKESEKRNKIKSEISKNETKIVKIDKTLANLQRDFDNSTDAIQGKHDGLGERNPGNIIYHVSHQIRIKKSMNKLRHQKDSLKKVNNTLKNNIDD